MHIGCPKTQKLSQKTMFPALSFFRCRDVQFVSQMSGTAWKVSGGAEESSLRNSVPRQHMGERPRGAAEARRRNGALL